jgi:hypothetical protein
MDNEVIQAMRCEEALTTWQQALLGRPVDKDTLEEAYAHFRTCKDVCARVLSSAPDFELFPEPQQRPGRVDYYEARGLAAEEEGDQHALEWKRLQRLAATGKTLQDALDGEWKRLQRLAATDTALQHTLDDEHRDEARGPAVEENEPDHAREWRHLRRLAARGKTLQDAIDYHSMMAIAAWQAAVNYYQDGLKIDETAFLTEGVKRLRQKRLKPPRAPQRHARATSAPQRAHNTTDRPPRAAPPAALPPQPQPSVQPLLSLVSRISPRAITVAQRPPGWQGLPARSHTPLFVRETSSLYSSSTQDTQEPGEIAAGEEPQLSGLLAPFDLALWVKESAHRWALDLLVRASSPRHPWSSILLTLEDQHQQYSQPTLMQFSQHDPQRIGWQARLKEITSGQYYLRLLANDTRGRRAKEAALELHLAAEE